MTTASTSIAISAGSVSSIGSVGSIGSVSSILTISSCIIICGVVISRETGWLSLTDVKLEHLGLSKSIESTRGWTTFIGGKGKLENITKQIEQIKVEIF